MADNFFGIGAIIDVLKSDVKRERMLLFYVYMKKRKNEKIMIISLLRANIRKKRILHIRSEAPSAQKRKTEEKKEDKKFDI
ncbi:hypothetical protein BpHYR1_033713 [Brachionus plicatilis]|uniref:Uncharacterized protein n=1 Tax=Brachionus plicatilis TaxID=10195 RepID=A0A3M7RNT3_BRAPC|nr:hypothetical protein BpHYR1_033713 [Brachionus plicatilis]